jgi:hypothetical protein
MVSSQTESPNSVVITASIESGSSAPMSTATNQLLGSQRVKRLVGTYQELSPNSDRETSAIDNVSILGLFPSKACEAAPRPSLMKLFKLLSEG